MDLDGLQRLIEILPQGVADYLRSSQECDELQEVVLDFGYFPEIRFAQSIHRLESLSRVSIENIQEVTQKISDFNTDNRAGLERTLHRISAIRNRHGKIIGLTCRVGRAIQGTLDFIQDVIESGKNVLFLGPPGIGKTTQLREAARILSDNFHRRVIVVDTSNEIGGDGDIPHSGIGSARRMQVSSPDRQHAVMIEAVENHMPQVIIVDELGTEEEAAAARTIAERGVQLIATAHGHTLQNLIKNPTLVDLIGGIQSVILGDDEAKLRGTQKTVLERKTYPTFDCLVEIRDRNTSAIYHNLASVIDAYLRGEESAPEIRQRAENGDISIEHPSHGIQEDVTEAMADISEICKQVHKEGRSREAAPQNESVRRLQKQAAYTQGLNAMSIGKEPYRRVRVYPK